jgi:hypothetical protein
MALRLIRSTLLLIRIRERVLNGESTTRAYYRIDGRKPEMNA